MAYTARRIPSPCGAGRGLGRGVAWEYQIVFKQCFQGFPPSPALSPLVPRGEREKTKRRLLSVPLSPILPTPLSARTIAGDLPGAKSFPARCVGDGHEGLRQAGEFRPVLGLKNFAAQQRRTDSQRRAAGRQESAAVCKSTPPVG